MFKNKTLLITGGTGSFGNAVLNRFLDTDIGEIRIFSRDEKKQHDMRKKYKSDKIKFYIGDVRDRSSIRSAMNSVDYVFHAAALKQVPSCEFHPMQAYKTNVQGTANMLDVAVDMGVKKIVCLSTDKAVYPINAMGISKAMMEKVASAKAREVDESKCMICSTRYGNVMASRGSVIPLFADQIRNGEQLTVTDPSMTRFLMSLEEAVDLVLFAFSNGHNGDVFVQKAPACTIEVLVEAIKQVFDSTASVKIIGTRHGEKLYETLVTREDMVKAEDLGDYFRIPPDNRDLNYDKYYKEGSQEVASYEDYHSHNTDRLDVAQVVERLMELDYIKNELKKISKG